MSKLLTISCLLGVFLISIPVFAQDKKDFQRVIGGDVKSPRILACDHPEFSFHLPEMAGNLHFGVENQGKNKWLKDFTQIKTKESKQKIIYKIKDEFIGKAELIIRVTNLSRTDGIILEAEIINLPAETYLTWSFGGCYGVELADKTDSHLKPSYCKDNVFSIEGNAFTCYYGESMKLRVIQGIAPLSSELKLSETYRQGVPALSGRTPLKNGEKLYFCIYKQNKQADYNYYMLRDLFEYEYNK